MKARKIGKSELEVFPLAFGGNVFGWSIDEKTSHQLLDAFVTEGFNFIDTADVYSAWAPGNKGGESEAIIGKWFASRKNREEIILATKVGMQVSSEKGLSRKHILKAVEDSLTRLQTDYIDLYQSHTDDSEAALDETLEAYSQLIDQGKVRVIGASNYSVQRLGQSLEVSQQYKYPRYECLQPLYNLYDREDFESNLEPFCQEKKISVIPYYSLASGFLTGKYRSKADLTKSKVRGSRVEKYMDDRGQKILSSLNIVAETLHATPAQVALAWLMARPSITAPIASATNLDQLKDLTGAAQLNLDPASIDTLNKASAY